MDKKRRASDDASAASTPSNLPSPSSAPLSAVPGSLVAELASEARSTDQDARSSLSLGPDDVAGPSRGGSASATPAPLRREERTNARHGTIVPGSGDGDEYGDECFIWADFPMNKNGYRYAPCTPSPNVSPNSLLPFYRTLPGPLPCPPVHLSWVDRSAFLRVSNDGLTATTDRGWRSARASVAVRSGAWYFEAVIEHGDGLGGAGKGSAGDLGNAHVRVGWARREAGLDAPVGACAYSYALRDVGGEKVHISRPKPYSSKGFATGDVVGCLIVLPSREEPEDKDEPGYVRRWRVPLRYKGQQYFEMDEYPAAKEMESLVNRQGEKFPAPAAEELPAPGDKKKVKKGAAAEKAKPARPIARPLKRLDGSYMTFFLNGEPMAATPAFTDLFDFLPLPPLPGHPKPGKGHDRERVLYHDDGTLGYFPMVSCFGRGKVRCNFSAPWQAPPQDLPEGTRGVAERWDEWRAEELVYDERDEIELAARYEKDMATQARADEKRAAAAAARAAAGGGEGSGTATPRSKSNKKRKKATPAPGEATPVAGTPAPEERMGLGGLSGGLGGLGGLAGLQGTPGASEPGTPYSAYPSPDKYRRGQSEDVRSEVDADGEDDEMDVDADADGQEEVSKPRVEDPEEGVRW